VRRNAPRIGKRAAVGDARRHQVARAAIQRDREFPGRKPRAVDDRLVIAGDKASGIAELADARRYEIGLEELPRRLGSEPAHLDRAGTDFLERGAYGSGLRRGLRLIAALCSGLVMNEPIAGVPCRLGTTELSAHRAAMPGLRTKRDRAHDRTTARV